jgi:hypothetical protein
VLDPERCGTLSPTDHQDFLTFRLKPTTRKLSLNFSGRVRLRVDVDGTTVELAPDSAGVVPFVQGKPYLIEVTELAPSTGEVPWTVTVVEK